MQGILGTRSPMSRSNHRDVLMRLQVVDLKVFEAPAVSQELARMPA